MKMSIAGERSKPAIGGTNLLINSKGGSIILAKKSKKLFAVN
jgi:hypothetical protein